MINKFSVIPAIVIAAFTLSACVPIEGGPVDPSTENGHGDGGSDDGGGGSSSY